MATLRALECLVAVTDTGSITEAARLLHSSQPAVSQQIAALERETRTPLLRREPRGVSLTPAGRAAVADARRAIDAAASAVRSARATGEAKGGSLRLVCAQSLTVPLLAPVIRAWHRHRSLSAAGIRLKPVLRTSVTSAAPPLAADGLGIAISPVSAVSAGFPGVVRSFSPRWTRQLIAVTPGEPDPLAARFIADLRTHGVRLPRDVKLQLES